MNCLAANCKELKHVDKEICEIKYGKIELLSIN